MIYVGVTFLTRCSWLHCSLCIVLCIASPEQPDPLTPKEINVTFVTVFLPAFVDDKVVQCKIRYLREGETDWQSTAAFSCKNLHQTISGLVENWIYTFTLTTSFAAGIFGPESYPLRVKTLPSNSGK